MIYGIVFWVLLGLLGIVVAASDTNTLSEWQQYAKLNNIPVKD